MAETSSVFLKLTGIEGESAIAGYEGQIDVSNFNWGMSQGGSLHVAKGAGTGISSVQDITVSKKDDKATPNLIRYGLTGTLIDEAVLTCIKTSNNEAIPYVIITLRPCVISSVSIGADGMGGMQENITLNFRHVNFTYKIQASDNSPGADIPVDFNVATNTEEPYSA